MPVGAIDGQSPSHMHKQCDHGYCLNHGPQWERVGKAHFRSYPSFFLKRTTFLDRWVHRHCETPMQRVSSYATQRCKLCGREEEILLDELAALCACCGYHVRVRHPAILCYIEREYKRKGIKI